jgi:hypothetical protein
MGTVVSFAVYAVFSLSTVFSPATGQVHASLNSNTGSGSSVTQVTTVNHGAETVVTSAL